MNATRQHTCGARIRAEWLRIAGCLALLYAPVCPRCRAYIQRGELRLVEGRK